MTTRPFRADIQGLRALAVLLVLLYHGGVSALSGGYVGVDVFFVISGFLITSHLFAEASSTGAIKFGRFYARRARRILPASFVVLALSTVAALAFLPPLQFEDDVPSVVATALYVPNLLFAVQGTNYLGSNAPSFTQQYWSLGVEEQFYAAWPLLLLGVFLLVRKNLRALVVATVAVSVASLLLSIWLTEWRQPWAFFLPFTRVWEFGLGAIVALWVASGRAIPSPRVGSILAWAGIAAVVMAGFTFDSSANFPGWIALLPAGGAAAAIIGGTSTTRWSPESVVLRWSPVQFVGAISYSLYLIHWPLIVIPTYSDGIGAALPVWSSLGLAALAIPLAWVSYRFVEEPFRVAPWSRTASNRRVLLTSLAATAALAVGAVGAGVASHARPLTTSAIAPALIAVEFPPGAIAVPQNLKPSLRDVSDSYPSIYDSGCHKDLGALASSPCWFGDNAGAPRVALFGDSHAAQWFPALHTLAEEGAIQLGVYTHSACPAAELPTATPACVDWHRAAQEDMIASKVDLALLGSFYDSFEGLLGSSPRQGWIDRLSVTINNLASGSVPSAILSDSPLPDNGSGRFAPPFCLSANLTDAARCAPAVDAALNADLRSAELTLGVPVIDTAPWLCNASTCPAVIDDTVVYRDDSHLTVEAATALSDVIRDQLAKAIVLAK